MKLSKTTVCVFVFLVVCATLRQAYGRDLWEINIGLGGSFTHIADKGFDPYSANDWLAAVQIELELETVSDLFFGAHYGQGGTYGKIFDTYDSKLKSYGASGFVRYRLPTKLPLITPYLIGEVGADFLLAEFGYSDGTKMDQLTTVPFGRLAAGVEFIIPRKLLVQDPDARFTIGAVAEVGYRIAATANFDSLNVDISSDEVEEGKELPRGKTSIGTLETQGWYMVFGVKFYL